MLALCFALCRFLTDFDRECANAQIVFSTSTITVGVNFKRNQQSKDVELSATHLTLSER